MAPYLVGHGFDRQRRSGFRLRWGGADAYPSSANARGGRATSAYSSANEGRYSDSYGYRVADACRYATGNPNGDAFPKGRCYALLTHPDALADGQNNEHADAPADADTGSYAYTHTDLASDDL